MSWPGLSRVRRPGWWLPLLLAASCGPAEAEPVRGPHATEPTFGQERPPEPTGAPRASAAKNPPEKPAGGSERDAGEAPQSEATKAADVVVDPVSGPIDRRLLLAVLDRGLGRFLQGVDTEPHVVDGRFVGFRILSLYPDDPRFAHVPIEPGDVLLEVNGRSIERPDQAMKVWKSLRVAGSLVLRYQRDGTLHEARYVIE